MTEVWFYHLERTTADAELPRLLQRGIERGLRMAVVTASMERVRDFSQKLWGLEDTAFMPHGFDGEPNPQHQPIFLCADDNPLNNAAFRFYVDGAAPQNLASQDRASIMFDGNDQTAVEQARLLWKRFKLENATIRYWKQDDEGRWKDQAAAST